MKMFIASSSLCATIGAPVSESSALTISLSSGSAGSQGGICLSVIINF